MKNSLCRTQRSRAFTLLEILIVLAIVAVLAAILFPVFSNVRESARTASCASNLRQLGVATELYLKDHNDFYPPVDFFTIRAQSSGVRGLNGCWADRIYPYVRSTEVFECPNLENGDFKPGGSLASISSTDNDYVHSGSYVPVMLSSPQMYTSRSRLNHPSDTILLLDGPDSTYFINPSNAPLNRVEDLINANVPQQRHNDGVNVLMADGRVKWMRLEDMLSPNLWTARKAS